MNPQAARILIVDDNESLVHMMEGVLQKQGFSVLTAFDGRQGVATARKEKPDLIILDIIMPEMDGYSACRLLQRNRATASIPILMLTVKGRVDQDVERDKQRTFQGQLEDRNQAFDAGAIEFLSKPVTANQLISRVKALLWLNASARSGKMIKPF
jgi:DNA-binding response OmpR family regulator